MKILELANTKLTALVDDEDVSTILNFSPFWYIGSANRVNARSINEKDPNDPTRGKRVFLHRLIMGLSSEDSRDVDHINRDPLDNRKENLRICEHYLNLHNVEKMNMPGLTSKYKGVSWHKKGRKWQVHLSVAGKRIYGGLFKTEKDAAIKANELMLQHVGEFACLNII